MDQAVATMEQEQEQDQSFDLQELARAVWRRKWLAALVGSTVAVLGVYAIAKVPVIYRATGVILVEQQEIPTQWVNSTVTSYADERIKAISQRVLSTSNLEKIIAEHNLFSGLDESLSSEQLAELARQNFTIENEFATIRDRTSGNQSSATVSFSVSYQDPSPEVARDVTAELVNLYLQENSLARTKSVTDTREFLEAEADRLENQLAEIESRISEFKQSNLGALPDQQDINLSTYQRAEQQIADVENQIRSLDEQRVVVESSIDSARRLLQASRSGFGSDTGVDPVRTRLIAAEAEYSNLKTKYSSVHPDLIRLRREIIDLTDQLANDPGTDTVASLGSEVSVRAQGSGSTVEDTGLVRLQTELQSIAIEKNALRSRKSELVAKLDDLEKKINKGPGVERDYRSLIRDHENIQAKYNDIRAKQNSARVAESLEEDQKAERFTLIEAPRLPINPHEPNYRKLFLGVLGASLLSGLGAVFAVEKIDGRIRTIAAVESLTGLPVLATVGVIQSPADRRRKILKILAALVIALSLAVLFMLLMRHYQLTPRDLDPRPFLSEIHQRLLKD